MLMTFADGFSYGEDCAKCRERKLDWDFQNAEREK
jgi:hypothetical protein